MKILIDAFILGVIQGIAEWLPISSSGHLVLAQDGIEIHPDVIDKATNKPLKFKPENQSMRNSILQIEYNQSEDDLFGSNTIELRPAPTERKAFEPAWMDYREGKIYSS